MISSCYSKLPTTHLLFLLISSALLTKRRRSSRLGSQSAVFLAASAIRLMNVDIPPVVAVGDTATLVCAMDLEKGDLYAVKWYKDGEEFYHYAPKREPPVQLYHVEGVHVDRTKSMGEKIVLRTLSIASSGFYRCEASAEAPSFSSVQGGGPLVVVILPRKSPQIFGGLQSNETDEYLDLNCTTDASRPAATVHWFINGVQVDPDLAQLSSTSWRVTGLEASISSLQIPLKDSRFFSQRGATTVTCQATIVTSSLIQENDLDVETSLSAWVSSSDSESFTSSSALQRGPDLWIKESSQYTDKLRNLQLQTSIIVFVNSSSGSVHCYLAPLAMAVLHISFRLFPL